MPTAKKDAAVSPVSAPVAKKKQAMAKGISGLAKPGKNAKSLKQ